VRPLLASALSPKRLLSTAVPVLRGSGNRHHSRATVHGFRPMASTVLNKMGFRSDVIERQLAHEERELRSCRL
jgi:hypothetical protein